MQTVLQEAAVREPVQAGVVTKVAAQAVAKGIQWAVSARSEESLTKPPEQALAHALRHRRRARSERP